MNITLPPPGGNGYHLRLLGEANRLAHGGVPPQEACRILREATPTGTRRVPDREIVQAVSKAHNEASARPRTRWHYQPRPAAKRFDPAAFMAKLQADADGITEVDVWEASPYRLDVPPEKDATLLLHTLYKPDDFLFIGDQYSTTVKTVAEWLADIETGKRMPPHIIPNPLTGKAGVTKDGKESFRADSCVNQFRFAVAEFDGLTRDEQIRFWWSVNFPLHALIDSGGKSLHGWVAIDGIKTAEQWADQVENKLFANYLIPLGCDSACRNEARLSRMPGHFRTEKKRWQRILWLSPKARKVRG